MAVTWNYENAGHLLRRAGFGGTPEEIQDFLERHENVSEAVDTLLEIRPSKKGPPKNGRDFRDAKRKQQRWWLKTILKSRRPADAAREKLVLFWHNHLASGQSKQPEVAFMSYQNSLFRLQGAGDFKTLMREFTRDPANLYYLDGIINYASDDGVHVNVNENYGREFLELFTTGIFQFQADGSDDPSKPNYTEADVHQLARAFTGWVEIQGGVGVWQEYAWDGGQYDDDGDDLPDDITIFGVTNNNFRIDEAVAGTADDIIELVFARLDDAGNNQVAMYLARKFWTWYAYPAPAPGLKALLSGFAAPFAASGFDIPTLLRAMFTHDEFYSDRAKSRTIKNPVDFAVQAMKALGVRSAAKEVGDSNGELGELLEAMGMDLFEPPNVAGWPGGQRWITTGTLLERISFARRLAEADRGSTRIKFSKASEIPIGDPAADPADVVDGVLRQLGLDAASTPFGLNATQRQALIDFASDGGSIATLDLSSERNQDVERRVRGLVALAIQAAENQVF
jgi:uncharacterized protein (DUF1800 family)